MIRYYDITIGKLETMAVTFDRAEWRTHVCNTYGGYPGTSIYVYFLPKYGRWSLRDQYEVMDCATKNEILHDIYPNGNVEGGYSFPCPPERRQGNTHPHNSDIRTYGADDARHLPREWRSVLDRPDVDDRQPISKGWDGRHYICLCCKYSPTLEQVAHLVRILCACGHHIIRTEGFAMTSTLFGNILDRVVKVGNAVKKVYVPDGQARKLQIKLGVVFEEKDYQCGGIDIVKQQIDKIRGKSDKADVMRIHLPYMLLFDDDTSTVYLVNRHYGPIGYDKFGRGSQLWDYPTHTRWEHLYDDGCTPWRSTTDYNNYYMKYIELVKDYKNCRIGGFRAKQDM